MFGSRTPSVRKLALSVSSWFCVPEQGMKEFEVLSRASAFLVKSRFNGKGKGSQHTFPKGVLENIDGVDLETLSQEQKDHLKKIHSFVPKYHIVTASHVVAPWMWPKCYPDDWLQHLNHNQTHSTVELRDAQGVFITQSECLPVSYHHPTRDLAILHFDEEASHSEILFGLDFEVPELLLPPLADTEVDIRASDVASSDGEENTPTGDLYSYVRGDGLGGRLQFVGHDVTDVNDIGGMGGTLAGMRAHGDNRRPIPQRTLGALHGRTNAQVFCTTSIPLTDGMCGGPVLWDSSKVQPVNDSTNKKSSDDVIVGMVEGIVPLDYQDKALRGLAVFVESPIINEFIEAIEIGPDAPGSGTRLIGGKSVNHMAKTQHTDEFQMPEL